MVHLNKEKKSELIWLTYDKVSQALINQLPFFTGLLFVTKNYQEYYQIITLVFLGISFGNLGLEKAFANPQLDIFQTLKRIVRFRMIFAAIVFLICVKYLNVGILVSVFCSLITFLNFTTLGEYLYVGKHLKSPLITVKIIIVFSGFFLRYFYNDTLSLIVILVAESVVFSTFLFISLQKGLKAQEPIIFHATNYKDSLYSFLLLSSSFFVTRVYVYYNLDLTVGELKYLHLSDYIVVLASFAGSVFIRFGLFENFRILLKLFFIVVSSILLFSLVIDNEIGYYLSAKIISAINVLYVYLLFSKNKFRGSFLINLGSLVIMLSFFWLGSKEVIFSWMMLAEFSVIFSAFLLRNLKLV